MPAPTSTSRLSEVMPHFAAMHSRTFCIPEHARVPYRPSMPSPPPSLFCSTSALVGRARRNYRMPSCKKGTAAILQLARRGLSNQVSLRPTCCTGPTSNDLMT